MSVGFDDPHLVDQGHLALSECPKAAEVRVLAVFSALSMAASVLRPQRSVRLNNASALMTTARSSRS